MLTRGETREGKEVNGKGGVGHGHPIKKEKPDFHWNLVHMWDRAPDVPKIYHD